MTWKPLNVSVLGSPSYSISNPFAVNDQWHVLVDAGGFRVAAASRSKSLGVVGEYTLVSGADTGMINTSSVPHAKNGSWIENPVVTTIPGNVTEGLGSEESPMYIALFDWVDGGGYPHGAPIPYIGFSFSSDGENWPEQNGELVKVGPVGPVNDASCDMEEADGQFWTDLVRTPTSGVLEPDGTITVFYAARDTRLELLLHSPFSSAFQSPEVRCFANQVYVSTLHQLFGAERLLLGDGSSAD
jgi:hypothetical protein